MLKNDNQGSQQQFYFKDKTFNFGFYKMASVFLKNISYAKNRQTNC